MLGAPITLLLRTVSPRARREIVAVLRDPAMKSMSGRVAGVGLTLEYYATMFLVMLTPLYRWSLEHESVHIAVHAYLLTCGLLFWMPLVGRDPAGWRPPARVKLAHGRARRARIPGPGLDRRRAVGTVGRPGTLTATHAAGWVLGAGGIALTGAGLAARRGSAAGARTGRASRERWNERRMLAMSKAMRTQQAIEPKR